MKRYLWLLVLECAALAQVPQIPYEADADFLKLPAGMYLGEVAGVAVNSKKHIFVFSRGNTTGPAYGAAAAQLLEFGPDGKYLREIGKNLYAWSYAHAVRIDADDNIWAMDKGSDMIIRFNPAGRVTMVFGRKKEASDDAGPWTHVTPPRPAVDGQFRQPTDVAWDPQGNIFISDGYINSRVAKYDKNGDWVKQWGEFGTSAGQFSTPHNIVADAQGEHLCRGSREPAHPGVRSATGNSCARSPSTFRFRRTPIPGWGISRRTKRPRSRTARRGPSASLRVRRSIYTARTHFRAAFTSCRWTASVLGVLGRSGRQAKQFGWIHEMACPAENELYVAEILNWRVQKLTLHPTK